MEVGQPCSPNSGSVEIFKLNFYIHLGQTGSRELFYHSANQPRSRLLYYFIPVAHGFCLWFLAPSPLHSVAHKLPPVFIAPSFLRFQAIPLLVRSGGQESSSRGYISAISACLRLAYYTVGKRSWLPPRS